MYTCKNTSNVCISFHLEIFRLGTGTRAETIIIFCCLFHEWTQNRYRSTPINSVSFALWKFWIKYSESTWCTKSGVWSELSTSTNIAHTSLVIIIYRSFNCLRKLKSSYYLRHYERWWSLFIFLWFHKWNLPTQEMLLQIKLFKADTMRSIKFVISLRCWIVLFIS